MLMFLLYLETLYLLKNIIRNNDEKNMDMLCSYFLSRNDGFFTDSRRKTKG